MSDVTATPPTTHAIRFPGADGACPSQDAETCEIRVDGRWRRVRFHDYGRIYAIPGLYEQLFYEHLRCESPRVVCELLGRVIAERGIDPSELRVLDVGAGNGMVGERLRGLGAGTVVGADILEEAREAAERDRPGVYDDYVAADLTDLSAEDAEILEDHRFNCLTSVAALGFGDIPPEAFTAALEFLEPGGLVAFTIKEEFLRHEGSGFSELIERSLADGSLKLVAEHRYVHRLSVTGQPIHYVAMIAVS